MSNRRVRIFLPLGLLLLGIAVFMVLLKTRPEPPRRPAAKPRPLVQVYEISDGPVTVTVSGFGSVRAKRKISLVPQVSGVVTHKSQGFEPGAFFTAGEVLLRIDETDYRLAVERASADVARAKYNLATAEEEAEVSRREWDKMRGSKSGVDTTLDEPNPLVLGEPQLLLAQAELAAAQAALTRAKVDLQRCIMKPDFDGRVLSVNVDLGQYIRAGNSLGTIYATDVAEVTVPIPDADLAWIQVPQAALGATGSANPSEGSVVDIRAEFAGGVHHWPGRAVRIAGAVDDLSRQVSLVVEIPDPYRLRDGQPPLVEGMFVEAVIAGRHLPGAVAIPRAALRSGENVWVVDAEEALWIRPVTVARAGVNKAIITAGLQPGERVCISSLQYVSDGMLVKVSVTTSQTPTTQQPDSLSIDPTLAASPGGETP